MSDALAIAAVTATLRSLLSHGTGIANVTTKPPDKARNGSTTGSQLNVFLYHTTLNPAWRNMAIPQQVKQGETGQPPLPLNLHYIVTAYGDDDDDTLSHRSLGQAMRVLHDHPVLGSSEIKDALPDSDLSAQIERVRITPQVLSIEEMSKLWTTFQTQYRISAAYEAQVVLIESKRTTRTPLPVLTRGKDDRGVRSQADVVPPFPTIEAVQPENGQQSARATESLVVKGFHLDGDSVALRFTSALPSVLRLPENLRPPPTIQSAQGTAEQVVAIVPNESAGLYTVAVLIRTAGEPDRFTNEWPLQIAPVVSAVTAASTTSGKVTFTVTCIPPVLPAQKVSLLIGDLDAAADDHTAGAASTLTFQVAGLLAGDYFVRLRVDGVDSLLVDRRTTPPSFDPSQKVTVA